MSGKWLELLKAAPLRCRTSMQRQVKADRQALPRACGTGLERLPDARRSWRCA